MSDPYRCRDGPATGCRQCGAKPRSPFRKYCGAECRDEFERNHFWPQAGWHAATLHGHKCVDCGARWRLTHHVRPLIDAGVHNRNFTCENHQSNLVPLCDSCHWIRHREIAKAKRRGAEPVRQLEISI